MKKLALEMETLQVESFETSTLRNSRDGTVRGHSFEEDMYYQELMLRQTTGDHTFNGSCYCNTQYSCPTQASCVTCPQPCIRF